jgi:hypothetical protein
MVFTWRRRRAEQVMVAGGIVLLSALGLSAFGTPAAATPAKTGYVRLAHLSPDTPDVDVYLDSLSSKQKEQVFKGVGYGTVSGYLPLPVGAYAVSMRVSGASPSTPPVLTTNVTVLAGHAYTVAGVGSHADLGLKVITDDLSSPMNGEAKVRIIQASIKAPLLDVSVDGGASIAAGVAFATTTPYRLVKAGVLTLRVQPTAGGTATLLHVTLAPDSVYSVLVLDGKTALTAQLRTDAARVGPVPTRGVETGAGGTAQGPSLLIPALTTALVALAIASILVARGRRHETWSTGRRPKSSSL